MLLGFFVLSSRCMFASWFFATCFGFMDTVFRLVHAFVQRFGLIK